MAKPPSRFKELDPTVVFYVSEARVAGRSADEIAADVKQRFDLDINRVQVFPIISEGFRRGYVQLAPPRDQWLEGRMMETFGRRQQRSERPKAIRVVTQGCELSLELVAGAAADQALEVIRSISRRLAAEARANGVSSPMPPPVHLGLGAGSTARFVARALARRLRTDPVPLVVHALSSGFNFYEPATAPVAFCNYFEEVPEVDHRGLFAPPYVASKDYEATCRLPSVREAFEAKDDIQVIVTALAAYDDEHGELNRFMDLNVEFGPATRRILDDEEGRQGDVLYQPFSEFGPITRETPIRPVTLFGIDELVEFAADPDRAVILVAGPCGAPDCRLSRSSALLPLLRQPSLDVWNHLVLDDVTATMCLQA